MPEQSMDEHIVGELKYLRDRFDGYIASDVTHRLCVQQQLSDIKVLVTKRTTENRVRINGITTLISVFVSASVAGIMLWFSSRFNS